MLRDSFYVLFHSEQFDHLICFSFFSSIFMFQEIVQFGGNTANFIEIVTGKSLGNQGMHFIFRSCCYFIDIFDVFVFISLYSDTHNRNCHCIDVLYGVYH